MAIIVPVDAHLITLLIRSYRIIEREVQVGKSKHVQRERVEDITEVPPGINQDGVNKAIEVSNKIWENAGIKFDLRATIPERIDAPGNNEEIDPPGFFYLASKFPAKRGVSLLFVKKFKSRDLGGEAAEKLAACILVPLGDKLTGDTLAHEFGHLLSLEHVPTESKGAHENLMYEALRADNKLTGPQVKKALESDLAKTALSLSKQSAAPSGTP